MSMLSRFRKSGGFVQLLEVIENCEPSKQSQLLAMVAHEDPGWAHLLKLKALTLERILLWPTGVIKMITVALPDPVLAAVYQICLVSNQGDTWMQALPSGKAAEIQKICSRQTFSEDEKAAAQIKVIHIVRELQHRGQLKFSAFDPTLEVEEKLIA